MTSGIRSVGECVKTWVLTCRVTTCCCVAPLRVGLSLIGYINLIVALVMIVGTATGIEMFSPMVSRVQATVLEDDASVVWVLVPAVDLAASVMLLCAIYVNDVSLCRLFMYFTSANILASIIMYAIVIATIELLNLIMIALSIAYQAYVIILVRSFRIELKLREVTDKTKLSYDNRYGIVTITDVSEPSTEIKLKDVRLEILDGKDSISIRGNTLPRSGTLQSSKSNTMGSTKSSTTTLQPLASGSSVDDPGVSSEINVLPKTTQDIGVSVTPLQIITSRPYLSSDRLKSSLKKDISQNVPNEGTVTTTTAVIETVKETAEDIKTDKTSQSGDKNAEASNTEETKIDVPKKKKRGIFSKKSKTKQTDNISESNK